MNRKEQRKEKKRQQLLVEFDLTQSNDQVKRPGELLDSPNIKKLKVDPSEPAKLSEEDYKALKAQLRERKKFLTQLPLFFLQNAGSIASLSTPYDHRNPILTSDVQQLLLYAIGGNFATTPPDRWCCLQKHNRLTHVVAFVIQGFSSADFLSNEHLFPKLTQACPDRVEVTTPCEYGSDIALDLARVPLTVNQKDAILKKCGSLEAALGSREMFKNFRVLFPVRDEEVDASGVKYVLPVRDMFPRTYLLMSFQQMIWENFPVPSLPGFENQKFPRFKPTKSTYSEPTPCSPIFAVDCEMCITKKGHELTRIAVVNEDLKVVYSTYVKPRRTIINYLTRFSGITEEILKDVTTTLRDVQKALQEILPDDAILAGHSLNCDLIAMKMTHPYVIDTTEIFNMQRGVKRKPKLSALALQFLKEEIQAGPAGHDPEEDAIATMKLVQLKLSKGFRFGDTAMMESEETALSECHLSTSIFNKANKFKKTVGVIAPASTIEVYKSFSFGDGSGGIDFKTTSSNEEAVTHLESAFANYNFALAHVDVQSKLVKYKEDEKMEKLVQQIDSWCDRVLSSISQNGLCVILFAGPNKDQFDNYMTEHSSNGNENGVNGVNKEIADSDSESDSKKKLKTDSSSTAPSPSPSTTQEQHGQGDSEKSKPQPLRRNGVCFVHINKPKSKN